MSKILIVEDDEFIRMLAARALQRGGTYDVELAADGESGLAKIAAAGGAFDLVISDIRMPGMDGIAMAQAAARSWPGIRILFVTGYADQRERTAELDGIVVGVLLKPFTLAEIRAKVETALAV